MPYYGGEITDEEWANSNLIKCSIEVWNTCIHCSYVYNERTVLAFHTSKQRDRFLSFPENVQLVKDLFMIDW